MYEKVCECVFVWVRGQYNVLGCLSYFLGLNVVLIIKRPLDVRVRLVTTTRPPTNTATMLRVLVLLGLAAYAHAFHTPTGHSFVVSRRISMCAPLRMTSAVAPKPYPEKQLWEDSFSAAATPVPKGTKWRNVRNAPGVLRHLLNPDSTDFR